MSKIEIHGNRKVLIIGTGMLGLALMDEFKKDKMWSAKILGHDEISIEKTSVMRNNFVGLLGKGHFDVVINTAAKTNVDECERFPEAALAVNTLGARNVANCCRFAMVPMLIHISTDYAFSRESRFDTIAEDCFSYNPVNQYGISKAAGEMCVKAEYDGIDMIGAIVVRTSRLFGKHRRNFVDFISEACLSDKVGNGENPIALSDTNFTIPTSTKYLSKRIVEMCNEKWFESGVQVKHIVNSASYVPSLYDYAYEIYEQMSALGLNVRLAFEKADGSDVRSLARRPVSSILLGGDRNEKNNDWTLELNRYIREKFNV